MANYNQKTYTFLAAKWIELSLSPSRINSNSFAHHDSRSRAWKQPDLNLLFASFLSNWIWRKISRVDLHLGGQWFDHWTRMEARASAARVIRVSSGRGIWLDENIKTKAQACLWADALQSRNETLARGFISSESSMLNRNLRITSSSDWPALYGNQMRDSYRSLSILGRDESEWVVVFEELQILCLMSDLSLELSVGSAAPIWARWICISMQISILVVVSSGICQKVTNSRTKLDIKIRIQQEIWRVRWLGVVKNWTVENRNKSERGTHKNTSF